MNTASESSKLLELRAKTDRQLLQMVSNRVNAGVAFTQAAVDASMRGSKAASHVLQARARKGYEEGRLLLACTRDISFGERRGFERKLQELAELLEGLSVSADLRVRAAS